MSGAAGVGHLSIGEVLSLVQQDFPDVTISKIRFLESQGLIAPERTAAGYRKFYDSDIERLRWILRQQRDHFLPLKVIRKMLDQGVDVSPEAQPTLWSAAASGPTSDAEHDHGEDAAAGEEAASREEAAERTRNGTEVPDRTIDVTDSAHRAGNAGATTPEREREDEERARYRSPAHPAVASARPRSAPAPAPEVRRRDEPTVEHEPRNADDPSGAPSEPPSSSGPPSSAGPDRRAHATPADVVAALQEEPPRRRGTPRRDDASSGTPVPSETPATPATPARAAGRPPARSGEPAEDLRLTSAELCDAAGVSAELLTDLEQFGLIEPTVLGGDPQYDGIALEVAKIAARYAELGVGARHLRMYKVSAEREAGFVEQLVVPLLKQRNPSARSEAVSRTEELQNMGAELHASLLRRRLGPTFRT